MTLDERFRTGLAKAREDDKKRLAWQSRDMGGRAATPQRDMAALGRTGVTADTTSRVPTDWGDVLRLPMRQLEGAGAVRPLTTTAVLPGGNRERDELRAENRYTTAVAQRGAEAVAKTQAIQSSRQTMLDALASEQGARDRLADINAERSKATQAQNMRWRSRENADPDLDAELAGLGQAAKNAYRPVEQVEYIKKHMGKTYGDTFTGQTGASFEMGTLGQESSQAWSRYLAVPTQENRDYAEAIDALRSNTGLRNERTLDKDATLPWLSQSLAGQLPQFIGQQAAGLSAGISGAGIGTLAAGPAGTVTGAKVGYAAGRANYSFETMQGAAFRSLLEAGVPEEIAQKAAKDEGLVSSLIEAADAGVDVFTLGAGKLLELLVNGAVKEVGKGAIKNVAKLLAGYGINILGEGIQEYAQEGVSIANQRQALAGTTGPLRLVGNAAGVTWDAVTGQDPQSAAQMNAAGIEGMKIAALTGGAQLAGNTAVSHLVGRARDPDVAIDGAYRAMGEHGPFSPEARTAMNRADAKLGNLSGPRMLPTGEEGLVQEKTASTGEAVGDFYFDAADMKISWKSRTYNQNGKTFVQSQDMQRMYQVPKQSEIQFEVEQDGAVALNDDVVSRLNPADYRDFIKAYADLNLVTKYDSEGRAVLENKPITVKSTGDEIVITQTGINDVAKKIRGAGIKNSDNVSSILLLDKLIENATPVSLEPNKHGKLSPFTYYAGRFHVGDRAYNVILHIKNATEGDRYHYHTLDKIEVDSTYGNPAQGGRYQKEMEPTSTDPILSPSNDEVKIQDMQFGGKDSSPVAQNDGGLGNLAGPRMLPTGRGALAPGDLVMLPEVKHIDTTGFPGYNIKKGGVFSGGEHQDIAGQEDAGNGIPGLSGRLGTDESRGGDRPANPSVPGFVRLSEQSHSKLRQYGLSSLGLEDVSSDSSVFSSALAQARASDGANGWAVTQKTPEDLAGDRVMLSKDGSSGLAVTPGGDIVAVFNNKAAGGPKGATTLLIPTAVANGGTKLDCYGPHLVKLYARYGFTPVARVAFNPEFANDGWTPDKGTPDIYFMVHNGDSADAVVDKMGTYPTYSREALSELPLMGYEQAQAYRDSLLERGKDASPVAENDTGMGGSVGAAKSAFGYQRENSRVGENTFSKMYADVLGEMESGGAGLSTLPYDVATEKQSVTRAQERLFADLEGEIADLPAREAWSGEDLDTAMGVLDRYLAQAKEDGDYQKAHVWARLVQEKGTTAGQMIQAFAKYSRTPQGILVDAMDMVEKTRLNGTRKAEVIREVQRQTEALEALQEGDRAGAIALIRDLSAARRTGGLFQGGKKMGQMLTGALEGDSFEHLKEVATAQTASIAADYLPKDTGRAVKSFHSMMMLSNFATVMRNLAGNNVFDPVDAWAGSTSMVPLDMLLSKVTGTRSVAVDGSWFSAKKRRGSIEGMTKSYIENALDVDVSGAESRYGQSSSRTFKMTGGALERFLSTWTKYQSYALQSTDEFQKGGIRAETQRGVDSLKEQGLIKDDSLDDAGDKMAKYRTFQDNTKASALMMGLHDVGNLIGFGDSGKQIGGNKVGAYGAGDLFLPFARVPANLVSRAAEYSPLGLAKGAVEVVGVLKDAKSGTVTAAQQAKAMRDVGRGLTGTTLIATFAGMALAGVLRVADDEGDKDVEAMNAAEGVSGTQLNLDAATRWLNGESTEWRDGDSLMSIGFLEPINAQMTTGALVAREAMEGSLTIGSFLKASADGTIQSLLDLPVMSNLQALVDGYSYSDAETTGGKIADAVVGFGAGNASSFLPNVVRASAKAGDPYYRDGYTSGTTAGETVDAIKMGLPMLRETLPAKLTPFGENKAYGGPPAMNALNSMLLPGAVVPLRQSEVSRELARVREETGANNIYPDRNAPRMVQYGGEKFELTADEREAYQKARGNKTYELMAGLVGTKRYKKATAEKQAELLNDAGSFADDMAKRELFTGRGVAYKSSRWEKANVAVEAGIGFDVYLEYKDRVSVLKEQKKSVEANAQARREIFADVRLTAAQKSTLDRALLSDVVVLPKDVNVDYGNSGSFTISQMSEAAQRKWPAVRDSFGLNAEEYKKIYSVYTDDNLTAKEKKEKLREIVGEYAKGNRLYGALGEREEK